MDNVRMEYWSAVWCGPCRAMVKPIAELKSEGWHIEKIDADEERDRAITSQIFSIPTCIIYKNGEIVNRFTGARDKKTILNALTRAAE